MSNVALIGAGNIGSRHLQSLASLGSDWEIAVVDPNPKAISVADARYLEVAENNAPIPAYHSTLDGLPESIDVCIIATSASGRLDLVRDILARSKCRYMILEKIVFQSEEDFVAAENLFRMHEVQVWVNCPRRQWPLFKTLKDALKGSEQIECHFSRSRFALTCNAVHLIDAFQYITGEAEIEIDASGLSDPIMDNKRVGYVEFTGTLKITNARNDTLTLIGYATDEAVPPIMTVMSDKHRWLFKQMDGTVGAASSSSDWEWVNETVSVPPQSQLTGQVVRDLMAAGACELTSLEESKKAHVPMLNAFLDRIEAATGERPKRCNIT